MYQMLDVWGKLCRSFFHLPPAVNQGEPEDAEDLELEILRMKGLLQKIMGGGTAEELIQFLNRATERSDKIKEVIIVWVNLIEVLVQHAEENYGTQRNIGKLKAAYVKEVIKELLNSGNFEIPKVPKYILPIILDGFVDWIIDTVVNATNKYDLWEASEAKPRSIWFSFLIACQKIIGWVVKAALFLARPFILFFRTLRPKFKLSPLVVSAIEAVKQQGLIEKNDEFLKGVIETFIWIGKHRDQLIAATELVFETIQLTERFVNATGPEKKRYAVRIIMAVLTDYGYVSKGGVGYTFLEAFIDIAIDTAVFLFNKRNVFTH